MTVYRNQPINGIEFGIGITFGRNVLNTRRFNAECSSMDFDDRAPYKGFSKALAGVL